MKIGFARFYQTWKFKHPEPNDFVKVFEDVSSMELTWFQNYWLNTTKKIDFSIDTVEKTKEGVKITFGNQGIPMPLEFEIKLQNGKSMNYYIPIDLTNNSKMDFNESTQTLPKWSCASKKYSVVLGDIKMKDISQINLDPQGVLPDVIMSNNSFSNP
jgi:aminopeptidase N